MVCDRGFYGLGGQGDVQGRHDTFAQLLCIRYNPLTYHLPVDQHRGRMPSPLEQGLREIVETGFTSTSTRSSPNSEAICFTRWIVRSHSSQYLWGTVKKSCLPVNR